MERRACRPSAFNFDFKKKGESCIFILRDIFRGLKLEHDRGFQDLTGHFNKKSYCILKSKWLADLYKQQYDCIPAVIKGFLDTFFLLFFLQNIRHIFSLSMFMYFFIIFSKKILCTIYLRIIIWNINKDDNIHK